MLLWPHTTQTKYLYSSDTRSISNIKLWPLDFLLFFAAVFASPHRKFRMNGDKQFISIKQS